MFHSGRVMLQPAERWLGDIQNRCTLGECFEVRQGMAENPPFLTQKGARELGPTFRAGQGVFVLTHDEIDSLGFDAHERALLRPYYSAASIDRFYVPPTTDQFVLYLSSRSVNDIDEYPNIARHLTRFRPLLDRRREVRSGKIQWWELHWPREERIFRNPRILAPQMGRQPRFALAELPTYVGFSTNVVVSSREVELSLTSLTGILNSQLAARWFARHAKRRGVNLEINGSALRQFPLPARNEQNEQILADLIVRRQSLAGQINLSDKREEAARLDRTIDDVVCRLYGVDLNCVCQ
ncbi:MAG: TaqI-like C-terminal specificity domain-containing protein [Pirellulaceae bacterium]